MTENYRVFYTIQDYTRSPTSLSELSTVWKIQPFLMYNKTINLNHSKLDKMYTARSNNFHLKLLKPFVFCTTLQILVRGVCPYQLCKLRLTTNNDVNKILCWLLSQQHQNPPPPPDTMVHIFSFFTYFVQFPWIQLTTMTLLCGCANHPLSAVARTTTCASPLS